MESGNGSHPLGSGPGKGSDSEGRTPQKLKQLALS